MKYKNFPKPLTISLTDEIYQTIEEKSEEMKISKGEYVRGILAKGLNVEKNEVNQNEKSKISKTK